MSLKLADLEKKLKDFAEAESDSEEDRAERTISMINEALESSEALKSLNYVVVRNGSYENRTNLKNESDVDICVKLLTYFYTDLPNGLTKEMIGVIPSNYRFEDFKEAVKKALIERFGVSNINDSDKAIKVRSNTCRIAADVVPCLEHRKYQQSTNDKYYFWSGIQLYGNDNKTIISWPDEHIKNCRNKNITTNYAYKKFVRVLRGINVEFKNSTNYCSAKVPAILIDSLLYDVPNQLFNTEDYITSTKNILGYIYERLTDVNNDSEWYEASGMKLLFSSSQTWTRQDATSFIVQAWNYLGFNNN